MMPCAAKRSLAKWRCSVEASSALLGMQPTLRQVPPSVLSFSTMAVLRPSCDGANGGDVTAGAAADDDELIIKIGHGERLAQTTAASANSVCRDGQAGGPPCCPISTCADSCLAGRNTKAQATSWPTPIRKSDAGKPAARLMRAGDITVIGHADLSIRHLLPPLRSQPLTSSCQSLDREMNKSLLARITPLVIAAILGGVISQVILPSIQLHAQTPAMLESYLYVHYSYGDTENVIKASLDDKLKQGWKIRTSLAGAGTGWIILAK